MSRCQDDPRSCTWLSSPETGQWGEARTPLTSRAPLTPEPANNRQIPARVSRVLSDLLPSSFGAGTGINPFSSKYSIQYLMTDIAGSRLILNIHRILYTVI